jgi:L-lysine 2,3-aminomutase
MPTTPAQQRHYEANKVRYIAQAADRRTMLTEMVRKAKMKPCADCGNEFPYYVMDLDHVRGTKVGGVSRLINRGNMSLLLVEIEKCDVVCANCHRIRTWERNNADVAQRESASLPS